MEKKIRHLEMVERAIARNGLYRIIIKCLTMFFITSMLALYDSYANDAYLMVVLVPMAVLCFIDAFYLQQQRLYSSLFDHVRYLSEDQIDFNLSPVLKDFQDDKNFFFQCLIALSVAGFYIPLAFIAVYDILHYLYF